MEEAALRLFEHGQGNPGGDLALNVLDCWNKAAEKATPAHIERLAKLFRSFPADTDTVKASFMKQAITYSEKHGTNPHGDPKLHYEFAKYYTSKQEFGSAHKQFLRANEPVEHADLLLKWQRHGYKGEVDLFITRAVLQCVLCNDA